MVGTISIEECNEFIRMGVDNISNEPIIVMAIMSTLVSLSVFQKVPKNIRKTSLFLSVFFGFIFCLYWIITKYKLP